MKIFLLSILLFFYGCSMQTINYNRNKITEKYSKKYQIFLDGEKVDFETIYLDKSNIRNIVVNKKSKELNINQKTNVKFFELRNLNLDSLSSGRRSWDKKKIDLIVIDGVLITDSLKDKIKLDPNAIKSLSILTNDKLNSVVSCRTYENDFLVITTK